MRWDARGTAALLVSALVGVTAGVIVGFTTGSSPPVERRPRRRHPSSSPSASGSADDPLGLDVPLKNLDCTGDTILVVGWGETRGVLSNAVSANTDGDVKYLETAKSCNTLYGAEKQDPPAYAAYLGPFDSLAEPCSLRMSVDHKSDVVTSLKPGVKIHVQCLCVLDPATFPTLAVGMESDTRPASTSARSNGCWSTSTRTPPTTSPASTTPRRATSSSRSRSSTPSTSTLRASSRS